MKWMTRGLVAVSVLIALGAAGSGAYALSASTSVNVTGNDHTRVTVTLAPGQSTTVQLPKGNDPIRMDLDKISTNGGQQHPSEVFSALINWDNNGAGMTWIGTNSDGTQAGGNSGTSTDIANLTCGTSCTIATLSPAPSDAKAVVLTANAATSSIDETYVINIWY